MIAKATAKGKSFQGIVNYLFKGRLAQRGQQEKQAKVLCASPDLELPRWSENHLYPYCCCCQSTDSKHS